MPRIITSALFTLTLATGACSLITDFQEPKVKEICNNGIDDDGDTFVDCQDQDCELSEVCMGGGEICTNGSDDDGDGAVDCTDDDCFEHPACRNSIESDCINGLDDDGDDLIDCDDPDCAVHCGFVEGNCSDGEDNDNDTLIDCMDPDCEADPACQSGNCIIDFAWFDLETPGLCPLDKECTFAMVWDGNADVLDAACMPVDGEHYLPSSEGRCPKGAANINGTCVTLCDAIHKPCPPFPGDDNATFAPHCRSQNLHPVLRENAFCVLNLGACDPYYQTGCPLDLDCKIDAHIQAESASTVIVMQGPYCTLPIWGLIQNEPCVANEECARGHSCIKDANNAGTCAKACDPLNTDSDSCPENTTCLSPVDGSWSTGFCLP